MAAMPYVLYTGLPKTAMLSTVGAAIKYGVIHLTQRSVQYWLKPSLASSLTLNTPALFVLPDWPDANWWPTLSSNGLFACVRYYPSGTSLFTTQ